MYNFIRKYYGDYYLETLLYRYRYALNIVTTTYYVWSPKNSIFDNEELNSGSWQPFNVSGLKWYKINNFPVSLVESMTKSTIANEEGVYGKNISSIVFPYSWFTPTNYDYILFNFLNKDDDVLYQIVNIEKIYVNTKETFYKCNIKSTGYTINDIEHDNLKQIEDVLFYDTLATNKLYRLEDYNQLVKTYYNSLKLITEVNNETIQNICMRSL